jgi:hypothetical protein
MTEILPVTFIWTDDGVMKPIDRFAPRCVKQFTVGEHYRMVVDEERSAVSHSHYFASVTEAWKNLPEEYASRFPTSDKLRKWCLIKAGYATEQSMVCKSSTDVAKFAALLGRMSEDSIVVQNGNVIKVYTAESQSSRSMNKERFQQSKTAVLDLLASMIGTSVEDLKANAGQAA